MATVIHLTVECAKWLCTFVRIAFQPYRHVIVSLHISIPAGEASSLVHGSPNELSHSIWASKFDVAFDALSIPQPSTAGRTQACSPEVLRYYCQQRLRQEWSWKSGNAETGREWMPNKKSPRRCRYDKMILGLRFRFILYLFYFIFILFYISLHLSSGLPRESFSCAHRSVLLVLAHDNCAQTGEMRVL